MFPFSKPKKNANKNGEATKTHHHPVYEAFITFDNSIQEKVKMLYEVLSESFEIEFLLDKPHLNMYRRDEYSKLMRNMLRCKLVFTCVNADYLRSPRARDVLTIAYTSSLPIIMLLFQDLQYKELTPIIFAIDGAPRINVFEYLENKLPLWNGPLLPELVLPVQTILARKLVIKPISEKRQAITAPDEEELINLRNRYENEAKHKEKRLNAHEDSFDSGPDNNFINPAKLQFRILKQNPLYGTIYGYNRMVRLECRKRFLITSSYNKSIITIDNAGNWIEKRNPGGLLRLPWAICVSAKDEIYVGDNEEKCVFVFNKHFRHLRTLAQKVLNAFNDMAIDDETNFLYVVSLYDSVLTVIDIDKDLIMKKVFISMPKFISLTSTRIFILTSDDTIYMKDKKTLDDYFKTEIDNSKYLSALTAFDSNHLLVTAYELSFDKRKSRNVYLCVIRIDESPREISKQVRKLNLTVDQVNDMVVMERHIVCVDDTHVNVFEYDDLDKLLNYDNESSSS